MKSMFYRFATLLLSLLLICSPCTTVFAASSPLEYVLTASENIDELKKDDEITISFVISSSESVKIDVFQNEIKYDTARYTLLEVSVPEPYASSTHIRGADGYVYMNYTGSSLLNLTAGSSMNIGSFKLKVNGDSGSIGIYSTNAKVRVKDGTNSQTYVPSCADLVPNATTPHTHSWSSEWSNDSSNHWYECTVSDCPIKDNNQKKGFASHTAGEWIVDKAATETENGLRHKECTDCGYTMLSETVPALGLPDYTITFVTNGGTVVSSVSAESGTVIDLTKYNTMRYGYTFTGWFTDVTLMSKVTYIKLTGDAVVYAGWEKIKTETPVVPETPTPPTTPDEPEVPTPPTTSDTPYIPAKLNGAEHFAYIVGYDDGTVRPEADITRAEVATIFFRLLKDEVREEYFTKNNNFTDVNSDDWYNTAVSTMAKMGVLKGYEGKFRPNDPITRAEFAAIVARFADKTGDNSVKFKDISGHWAEREILKAASLGWISGYNGNYRPDDSITRAESMAIINRVLCRIPENEDDLLSGMSVWKDNADTSKWYYLAVQEATNSHTFKYKNGTYESWVALVANPDWSKLQ